MGEVERVCLDYPLLSWVKVGSTVTTINQRLILQIFKFQIANKFMTILFKSFKDRENVYMDTYFLHSVHIYNYFLQTFLTDLTRKIFHNPETSENRTSLPCPERVQFKEVPLLHVHT